MLYKRVPRLTVGPWSFYRADFAASFFSSKATRNTPLLLVTWLVLIKSALAVPSIRFRRGRQTKNRSAFCTSVRPLMSTFFLHRYVKYAVLLELLPVLAPPPTFRVPCENSDRAVVGFCRCWLCCWTMESRLCRWSLARRQRSRVRSPMYACLFLCNVSAGGGGEPSRYAYTPPLRRWHSPPQGVAVSREIHVLNVEL